MLRQMLESRGNDLRIDYVRYIIRQSDANMAVTEEQSLVTELENEFNNLGKVGEKQPWALGRIYDSQTRQSCRFIEVWGSLAHVFFWIIPVQRLPNISRIDMRAEAAWHDLDFGRLKLSASQCRYASKRRIQTIESPIRSKKGGRDAGGVGLSIGSHGSERRVSVYKRGKNEPYAVECQFSKGLPLTFWQTAKNTAHNYSHNIRHAYVGAVLEAFDNTLKEYLGVEPDAFLKEGTATMSDPLGLFDKPVELPTVKPVDLDLFVTSLVTNNLSMLSDETIATMADVFEKEFISRANQHTVWQRYELTPEGLQTPIQGEPQDAPGDTITDDIQPMADSEAPGTNQPDVPRSDRSSNISSLDWPLVGDSDIDRFD